MPNATEYKNKFISENYDRINLTVPKGRKEEIKLRAEKLGLSVNNYINSLIASDMNKPVETKSVPKKELESYLL